MWRKKMIITIMTMTSNGDRHAQNKRVYSWVNIYKTKQEKAQRSWNACCKSSFRLIFLHFICSSIQICHSVVAPRMIFFLSVVLSSSARSLQCRAGLIFRTCIQTVFGRIQFGMYTMYLFTNPSSSLLAVHTINT